MSFEYAGISIRLSIHQDIEAPPLLKGDGNILELFKRELAETCRIGQGKIHQSRMTPSVDSSIYTR